jgi:ubiquinol-cytochrome c reductase cytochrome b subunit
MIIDRLARAVDDRLSTAPVVRKALAKIFPDHWSFMLGEIALYAFVALVLTGVYLTLFFEPSTADRVYTGSYAPLDGATTSAAYASTVRLSFDVRAGLLMRQAHHWAALVFVGAILLHLSRIFFTGAFRKPRELNWLIGVTMLALALLNGFTGYSMPDDLLSGTGLRIIYSVVLSIPVVGAWLAFLAFGGEFPADLTIPRLFVSHVFIVPAVLTALITVHLAILVRQKHSQFPGPGRTENNVVGSRFWPSYTIRTMSLFAWVLAVLFALGGLAQINPVWIYGPFNPAQVTSPAQPDWYVTWGDGALRLFPAVEFRIFGHLVPAPFLPGVGLGTLTFLLLYLVPWLDRRRIRGGASHQLLDPPRRHPVRVGAGVTALTFFFLLLVAAADDIIAKILHVPLLDVLSVLRVLVLVVPIPAGMLALVLARALRANRGLTIGELTRADLATARRRVPVGVGADAAGIDPAGEPRHAPPTDPPDGLIELWPESDRTWRWRYRADDISLTSNQSYLSRTTAEDAARTAYRGHPVLFVEAPQAPLPKARRMAREAGRRVGRIGGWLALLVIGTRRRRRHRVAQSAVEEDIPKC